MDKEGLNSNENLTSGLGLDEAATKLRLIKKKVTHGKLSVQRKKIKAQVMKKSKPKDTEREKICRKAREKAHNSVANTRRDISNSVRKSIKENKLVVVNPNAKTISEAFDLDFMEEANGAPINVTFFNEPVQTMISESLTNTTGYKAIGFAEGCFQPILTPDGEKVFSRNKRYYDTDHWQYQLTERGLSQRVLTRDMVGTIGHHDKKVDDSDFADEKVSHVVTALEIREDKEHGVYLWGRLEILDTKAGRALKTYYDSGIPFYVSSRGGGKLLKVAGQDYERVDKTRYFCETFDVVRRPGYLEAQPVYHALLSESEISQFNECSEKEENKLLTATDDNSITEEDNNMKKDEKNTASTDTQLSEIVEKLNTLTDVVAKISSDIYEETKTEEAPAETKTEEAPAETKTEEAPAETEVVEEAEASAETETAEAPAAEETKTEEAPIEEKVDDEKTAEDEKTEVPADEPAIEEGEKSKSEEKVETIPEAEDPKKDEKEDKGGEKCGKEGCPACKDDDKKKEKVDEEWAKESPKETAPATTDPHLAKVPKAPTPMKGDTYAHEEPGTDTAPDATKAPKDAVTDEKHVAVKNASITEAQTEEAVTQTPAPEGEGIEVIDYKAMYESSKQEVSDAIKIIDEMIETFHDFGKRHKEIVESKQSEIDLINSQLNSYKIAEKFNITVEEATKKLSSKTYDEVVEELKAEEAKKEEEEAQAKVEKVTESLGSTEEAVVPAKRSVYSVFSAPAQEASEVISEDVETPVKSRKVFTWF